MSIILGPLILIKESLMIYDTLILYDMYFWFKSRIIYWSNTIYDKYYKLGKWQRIDISIESCLRDDIYSVLPKQTETKKVTSKGNIRTKSKSEVNPKKQAKNISKIIVRVHVPLHYSFAVFLFYRFSPSCNDYYFLHCSHGSVVVYSKFSRGKQNISGMRMPF